jgi:hypothetical protein
MASAFSEQFFYQACEEDQYDDVVESVNHRDLTDSMMKKGARISFYHNNLQIFDYLNDIIDMTLSDYFEEIEEDEIFIDNEIKEHDYTILDVNFGTYRFYIGPLYAQFSGENMDLAVRVIYNSYIFYTKSHDQLLDHYVSRDEIGIIFAGDIVDDNNEVISEDISEEIVERIGKLWSIGHTEFVKAQISDKMALCEYPEGHDRDATQWQLFNNLNERLADEYKRY